MPNKQGNLTASVGYGGTNDDYDVILVQLLLNNHISFGTTLSKWGIQPLVADGKINKWSKSDPTIVAIIIFQREVQGMSKPDGKVSKHGDTIDWLKGSPKAPRKSKSSGWAEYYGSTVYSSSTLYSKGIKDWLSKAPKHRIEVGVFGSKPGSRLTIWRSTDSGTLSKYATSMKIQSYWERSTNFDKVRKQHNLEKTNRDIGAWEIALTNDAWNTFMSYYVVEKGVPVSSAKPETRRKMHQEGKMTMSLVISVVGGASGAKGPAKPTIPINDVAKMPWKGFVNAMDNYFKFLFKRDVGTKHLYNSVTERFEVLKSSDGKRLGVVKYID